MSITSFADSASTSKAAVGGRNGIVAAQNRIAAAIGADLLRAGGNAVDAAVGAAFALAVVEPWMSGLGGGGVMLVHHAGDGRTHGVDFGMVAPARLDPDDYPLSGSAGGDLFGWPGVRDDRNIHGPLAMAVPGSVDGLGLALERFGTMPLCDVVAPALALAERGVPIDWYASLLTSNAAADLRRYAPSAAVWLPDGLPPRPDPSGTDVHLPLKGLAATLAAIARDGRRSFYEGDLARRVVADLAAVGSRIDARDLSSYRAGVCTVSPVPYGAHRVAAMPGLYAGGSLLEALGQLPPAPGPCDMAAALETAMATRLSSIGDSRLAPGTTTHIAAADRLGNSVSLTHTLLSSFGSRVVLPTTGILMNNGIMWFDPRPGRPNSIGAGKRPLSNMCPAIALAADGRTLALGASGGRKILPAVLQILSFVLDDDDELDAAFARPRIDSSGSLPITIDSRLAADVKAALAARWPVREVAPCVYPLHWACPIGVLREPDGMLWGATEPMQPWADAVALD